MRLVAAGLAAAVLAAVPADAAVRSVQLRVGLVLQPGGASDFYQRIAVRGVIRAGKELRVQVRVVDPSPREGMAPSMGAFAREGYDLVLALGFLSADAVDAAALRYPHTRFAIVDAPRDALKHRPPNVRNVNFREEEAAYLAGYLGASMEKRRPGPDVVSSVGGYSIPTVDHFIVGYQAGARAAAPAVVTLRAYANNFIDPAKCKAVAFAQIARGAGVVFPVAGGCSLGALDAAKARGVYGIGVDSDLSSLGSFVLTSVLKRTDVAVYRTIKALQDGRFSGGQVRLGLREGGVGLGKLSPRVPPALVRRIRALETQIAAGRIRVPSGVS